jgi:hypothetical protein
MYVTEGIIVDEVIWRDEEKDVTSTLTIALYTFSKLQASSLTCEPTYTYCLSPHANCMSHGETPTNAIKSLLRIEKPIVTLSESCGKLREDDGGAQRGCVAWTRRTSGQADRRQRWLRGLVWYGTG